MKKYIVPITLILAAIAALLGIAVFTMALFGDGVEIGGMTFYYK